MPFPAKRHPDELIAAIVAHADTGETAIATRDLLLVGQLDGWDGPYDVPLSTCRYYIREARKARNAHQASVSLEQGLAGAVHDTAKRVYTALSERLDAALDSKEPVDIGFLDSVAKTLKTLAELSKHKPTSRPPADGTEGQEAGTQPVTDPILLAAGDRGPVPDTHLVSESKTENSQGTQWRSQGDDTNQRDNADAGSVPSDLA